MPSSDPSVGWVLQYTPSPNYCSPPTGSNIPEDTFRYTIQNQKGVFYPQELQVTLPVTCINDNPRITSSATVFATFGSSSTTNAKMQDISVWDDNQVSPANQLLTIKARRSECIDIFFDPTLPASMSPGCASTTQVTLNGVLFLQLRCTAPLAAINLAFSNGLEFVPRTTGTGLIQISVNDLQGGSTSTNITVVISAPGGSSVVAAPVTAALVGVTTVLSMAVFGTYKVMKNKKLLPEEADPWENDELFDATLDNPLYAGAPISFSSVE